MPAPFNPSKHKRAGKGTKQGGQFTKGQGTSTDQKDPGGERGLTPEQLKAASKKAEENVFRARDLAERANRIEDPVKRKELMDRLSEIHGDDSLVGLTPEDEVGGRGK